MSNFTDKEKMFQFINETLIDRIFVNGERSLRKIEVFLEKKISAFENIFWKDVAEELGRKKLNNIASYQKELEVLKKECDQLRKLYEEEQTEKIKLKEGFKNQEKTELDSIKQLILQYREKVFFLIFLNFLIF